MKITQLTSILAAILAAAALAFALTHAGPRGVAGQRGPAGPQGQTGHNAEVAHLGLCVEWDSTGTYVAYIATPTAIDGVPSCPTGQFTSIVPQNLTGQ
jgi:hypothetical protein